MKLLLKRSRYMGSTLLLAAVAACGYIAPGAVSLEKDRLVAAGYTVASGSSENAGRYVLEYSGPPRGEILCRPADGEAFMPLPETALLIDGKIRYRSDVLVTLFRLEGLTSEPYQRDAFYVLTAIGSRANSDRAEVIETITFAGDGEASFGSGMTCRAG